MEERDKGVWNERDAWDLWRPPLSHGVREAAKLPRGPNLAHFDKSRGIALNQCPHVPSLAFVLLPAAHLPPPPQRVFVAAWPPASLGPRINKERIHLSPQESESVFPGDGLTLEMHQVNLSIQVAKNPANWGTKHLDGYN